MRLGYRLRRLFKVTRFRMVETSKSTEVNVRPRVTDDEEIVGADRRLAKPHIIFIETVEIPQYRPLMSASYPSIRFRLLYNFLWSLCIFTTVLSTCILTSTCS